MDALNTPVRRGRRETHTADFEQGQLPDIVMPGLDEIVNREPESIAVADGPISKDYASELAFNEEVLTIRIEPLREKNPPKMIDVYVMGRAEWIPVGQPYKVKRKYVDVLARCKPIGVTTQVGTTNDENPENRIVRSVSSQYPFSVIHDPSGAKGADWLTKIMYEV